MVHEEPPERPYERRRRELWHENRVRRATKPRTRNGRFTFKRDKINAADQRFRSFAPARCHSPLSAVLAAAYELLSFKREEDVRRLRWSWEA